MASDKFRFERAFFKVVCQHQQSTVPKKIATGPFTHNSYPKNAHKNAPKSSINLKPSTHSVVSTGANFTEQKVWLSMCLLAVLGSQGIVLKCTTAIFLLVR